MRESYTGRHRLPTAGSGSTNLSRSAVGLALGACLCAGQLLTGDPAPASAAPASAPVPAPASAAPASVPVAAPAGRAAAAAVRVSPSFKRKTVRYGQSALVATHVVDGRTGKALANRRATIQYTIGKGWRTAKVMKTSGHGNAWLTVRPTRETAYRVLVANASSGEIRVKVTGIPRDTKAQRVLAEARKQVGKPYRFGADGPGSFDCSGLTKHVYGKVGRDLPHRANSQQRYGRAVARSAKKPGDLLVFRRGSYGYHVAIYAGGGYMYDAAKPGTRVAKRKIWSNNYVVRRLV